MCRVVAKLNSKDLEVVVVSEETRATKEYKALNLTNKFPLLETSEGTLSESHAIAKFLAAGSPTLLGSSPLERAKIDAWMNWVQSGTLQGFYPALRSVFGHGEVTQQEFNDASKGIKDALRSLDQSLKTDYLTGAKLTVADVVLAVTFMMAFQVLLDQGFKKAAPKACAWFERVAAVPEFISVFGKVKMAKKALKPVIKTEEKPKKQQQQQAAKPKPAEGEEEKKEKNPLDCLPPSSFNLFDFKTFYVNCADKAGEGMVEFEKQYDPEGYSFWFFHYEKFGSEGQVYYKFENLLKGFLQRLDHFRKHAFGKMCILNEEPSLEIQGVFVLRGQVIPQELIDHPQFEYFQQRKLDIKVDADKKLIGEFFSSADGQEGTVNGMKVQISLWHK